MNRIYQGKVTAVEISDGKDERGQPKWKKLDDWQSILWQHHQLFQDAVNYYLVALASLGHTPGRVLTQLRERVAAVWDDATKKGQEREGMNAAFRRRFGGEKAPALEEIVEWFQRPLIDDGVPMSTAEKAGEFLLHRLGGESAIQQGGRVFWPMFCNPDSTPTFSLVKERLARSADEKMLAEKLYADLDDNAIKQVAESIHLGSVVNLEPGAILKDEEAKERLKMAATELGRAELHAMIDDLNLPLEIPKNRGGKINMDRVNACLLFKYLPSADTKAIFRDTFAAPKQAKPGAKKSRKATEKKTRDEDFIVDGDDPIRLSRGTRGRVFPAFTNLKFWATEPSRPVQWSEFDIAAFKEALKVLNQFHQNVARRAEKLAQLRGRLEWMDGTSTDKSFLEANEPEPPVFKNKRGHQDPRIQRLREIVDKELAEEYRLTEGRSTSYGLRRRTMKGWAT